MPAAAFVSTVLHPIYEMVMGLPSATFSNLNSPFMSENTPFLLPFRNTDAPIIGSPCSSTTVPEHTNSCACITVDSNETNNVRMKDFAFFIQIITFCFV